MGTPRVIAHLSSSTVQPFDGDQRGPLAHHVRLSDIEGTFTCQACGRRGADVRPDWRTMDAYA